MNLNKILEKGVDFIFSKDNRKWLILIFVLGLLLRILIAVRLPFNADEMVHGTHSIGFISSGKLQIMDQDAIWFFLTDLSMSIFGYNLFGVRFLSVFLGALLIILVYLIGKEVFDKKTGLIAAFILAFSAFQLFETRAEMDISMTFFAMLAMYFSILFFKSGSKKFFLLSWLSLGISIMMKQIAVMFIPALCLFYLYYNKKHHHNFKLNQILQAAIIILIIVSPVLTFNYLLYKDKGILDLQFARFTKTSFETYASIAPTIQPFSLKSLFFDYFGENIPGVIISFTRTFEVCNPIILFLFFLGAFFLIKSKNNFRWLLVLCFLFPYLFLAGTSAMTSHLVFMVPFMALLSSLSIIKISEFEAVKKYSKTFLYLVLILILIFSFVKIYNSQAKGFFGKNEMQKLIEFKTKNIGKDSLVIADSRIYRGRIVFMFWDKHYIEALNFQQLAQNLGNIQGQPAQIETYFIQCINTDCGWGTVKNQPEFNQSMEALVSLFKNNSRLVETIYDVNKQPYFNIYKQTFKFNSGIIDIADSTHEWFFYPVAYKPENKVFDNYNINNVFDKLLDKFAHWILYSEVVLAVILAFFTFYLAHKNY